ncbi:AMP-binding protein [Geminocystis sp. GBBB08]|uniref:AMP-binding protein n=1 Tax=Geminocystis sp. GBBB08 TaxID=2604140 RepID=UPI0027E36826|nr:AMP-binding protein [Geminocystis sp. GBBB08]MBL1209089.1 AMP-binding protein [Geminocystis sp. GBBB08]
MNNFLQILSYIAKKKPDKLAYIFLKDGENHKEIITYRKLRNKSLSIASQLKSITITPSRALLIYPQGLDFIAAFLGCLESGIIAVPAYPPKGNQKMSRLEAIIQDCQPDLILTTNSLLDKVKEKLADVINNKKIQFLATDNLTKILPINENETGKITEETIAFLQYTSGSTGNPKGVKITHNNILHNVAYIQKAFQLTEDSISVSWLPSFHDMGLIDGILQPLYTGFLGVIMSPEAFLQKPIRWLQAISDYRATHSGGPNFAYELCVEKITYKQLENLDLSSWLSAYNGSEPVRRSTIDNFISKFTSCGFKANYFYPCYGMAEATLMISGGELEKQAVYLDVDGDKLRENLVCKIDENTKNIKQLVGCGHSSQDTDIKIVNPITKVVCDDNHIGEIWVSGKSIAEGYWRKPEISHDTFKATLVNTELPHFLRTGDLGFLRQGELFITGREKDLIIIRGKNHYPQDIEYTVQNSHQALRRDSGAAFTIEKDNQEKLVIVQEIKRTYVSKLDVDEVVSAIKEAVSLKHELQIEAIALIKPASIPKTSSGKIQRYTCRQSFLEESLNLVAQWQQKSSLKDSMTANIIITDKETITTWLIKKLATVLALEEEDLDTETSFSQYGLDSSVALTLTGELSTLLNLELEATLFWEYTDIEELTEYLWKEFENGQK